LFISHLDPTEICAPQSGTKPQIIMTLLGRWTAFLNARWRSPFHSLSGEQERKLANHGDGQPVVSTCHGTIDVNPQYPAGRELVERLCRDRSNGRRVAGPTRCRTIKSVRHCIPSAGRPACAWRCNPTEPPRRRVGWHCGMGGDSLGEAESVEIDL